MSWLLLTTRWSTRRTVLSNRVRVPGSSSDIRLICVEVWDSSATRCLASPAVAAASDMKL